MDGYSGDGVGTKRPRSEELGPAQPVLGPAQPALGPAQPVPVRRLRIYNCSNFSYHDITLLSDHTVSVNGGPAHGSWEEEAEGLRRIAIAWHWASDHSRARRCEYHPLQQGLWAHVARDTQWNKFVVLLD